MSCPGPFYQAIAFSLLCLEQPFPTLLPEPGFELYLPDPEPSPLSLCSPASHVEGMELPLGMFSDFSGLLKVGMSEATGVVKQLAQVHRLGWDPDPIT